MNPTIKSLPVTLGVTATRGGFRVSLKIKETAYLAHPAFKQSRWGLEGDLLSGLVLVPNPAADPSFKFTTKSWAGSYKVDFPQCHTGGLPTVHPRTFNGQLHLDGRITFEPTLVKDWAERAPRRRKARVSTDPVAAARSVREALSVLMKQSEIIVLIDGTALTPDRLQFKKQVLTDWEF